MKYNSEGEKVEVKIGLNLEQETDPKQFKIQRIKNYYLGINQKDNELFERT